MQINCPIPSDQLNLLRLLSSTAKQELTVHSSKQGIKFIGANGDTFDGEHIHEQKVDTCTLQTHACTQMHILTYTCILNAHTQRTPT